MSLNPTPLFVLRSPNQYSVTAICFTRHDENNYIISGLENGDLLVWSLSHWRCIHTIVGQVENSRIIKLISLRTHDGQFLCQYRSGLINIYNGDYSVLHSFQSAMSFSKCFVYFDESYQEQTSQEEVPAIAKYLLTPSVTCNQSSSLGSSVDLTDMTTTPFTIKCTIGSENSKYGICMGNCLIKWSNDIYLVLIAYETGMLTLFQLNSDLSKHHLIQALQCHDVKQSGDQIVSDTNDSSNVNMSEAIEVSMTCVSFNTNTHTVVCGFSNQIISVCTIKYDSLTTYHSLSLLHQLPITNPGLLSCTIRPDGRIFATGGADSRVRVFGVKSGKALAVLDMNRDVIESVAFSKRLEGDDMDGFLLAAASKDKTITVWSIYN